MASLYRYSIRHPIVVLVLAAVVIMAIAPGVTHLTLRTDGHALVPADRPEVRHDRVVRDRFDARDQIVVLVLSDHPDGIFNTHTLELIEKLTRAFQSLNGIIPHGVSSLATEHSHRLIPGTIHARRLLDPMPSTPHALAELRADLEKIRLHTGTAVSLDGKSASILVGVPVDADRTDLYRRVRDVIAAHGPQPERFHVIGPPVAEALLGEHILEDLGVPRPLLEGEWRFPRSPAGLWESMGGRVGLVPIAIVIMVLVFAISFRSITAAMLPLIEVGACLAFVFGLMGLCEVPVYLTIAVMPIILTAVGVADEIHVFTRYTQGLRADPGGAQVDVLLTAMDEMYRPIVQTSVTTTIGFLCFALSPLGPVRAFGIFTSAGIMFCMVWSLTVIPAMLVLLNPRRFLRPRGETPAEMTSDGSRGGAFARLGALVARRRYLVLAVALCVVATIPFGLARLVVQDSWIDGFASGSEFHQATDLFNDQFLGSHLLLLCVEAESRKFAVEIPATRVEHHRLILPADAVGDPEFLVGQRVFLRRQKPARMGHSPRDGPRRADEWQTRVESAKREGDRVVLTTERRRGSLVIGMQLERDELLTCEVRVEPFMLPDVIRRLADLEAFVATKHDLTVGGVIGPAAYVATTNLISRGLHENARRIPDTPDGVERLWTHYNRVRGSERLRQVIDSGFGCSLVTVFLKNANFVDVQALMDTIRDYAADNLAPHGLSLSFAGDVAVSQTVIDAIVTTQKRSLITSLIAILAITALFGRSLRWGALCVLPCGLTVAVSFAVMGWVGVPLGVATSMFAGMTLGIGVDFAIHLLARYRLARARGCEPETAVADAVAATGPAIAIDAVAVALGFGVMMLSQVPANARLGALLVFSVLGCLAATLLLVPALLRTLRL